MTRESQIGLTLVLILCGVFGFFVYKKISNPTAAIAAAPEAGGSAPETPPTDAGTPADLPGEQPNEDLLKVASKDSPLAAPATFNRKLPDTPVAAPPRTPVEPKAKPFPDDDVFGAPAAKTVATPAPRPKLPTSIPDDEDDAFGAPIRPAKPASIASRSTGSMEVTSATVVDESDDPFGAPPQRAEPAGSEPEPFDSREVASTGTQAESDDPFGAPAASARPKLPTVTNDAFSDPPEQPAASESDPVGAPANPIALQSPVAETPRAARPADDELGFDAAPTSSSRPKPANPVRLSLPVAEESESDPFGGPEPKTATATAPPATLGDPEFDSPPVARSAPTLRLPTNIEDDGPDGFEPPVELKQPEPVELTRSSAAEDDPFGTAAAESTTDVRRSEPAASTFAQEPDEPEFAPPRRTLAPQPSSIGGALPRPAPILPLVETETIPEARPAPTPRPVAINLPKPGPIAAEQHSVEPNQNFWTLSQRRYGSGRYSEALAAHNKEKVPDPTAIRLGTVVSLPAAQILEQQYPDLISKLAEPEVDPRSVVAGPEQYVIQDGDSFWRISKNVYGDPRYWDALQKHNSETAKLPTLKPGTIISTPPVSVLDQKYASLITPPAAKPTTPAGVALRESGTNADPGLFTAADGQPLYRVGDGDNLSGIARATLGRSSRWVQILHLNRDTLKDGNDLTPGTVLRMPADATQVQMSSLERDRR